MSASNRGESKPNEPTARKQRFSPYARKKHLLQLAHIQNDVKAASAGFDRLISILIGQTEATSHLSNTENKQGDTAPAHLLDLQSTAATAKNLREKITFLLESLEIQAILAHALRMSQPPQASNHDLDFLNASITTSSEETALPQTYSPQALLSPIQIPDSKLSSPHPLTPTSAMLSCSLPSPPVTPPSSIAPLSSSHFSQLSPSPHPVSGAYSSSSPTLFCAPEGPPQRTVMTNMDATPRNMI